MAELHPDHDWASASILLDLWKALFEQVSHRRLVQAAIKLGCPLWLAKLQISLCTVRRGCFTSTGADRRSC
eukprot:6291307-Pyramimonas_sp.AAC.1